MDSWTHTVLSHNPRAITFYGSFWKTKVSVELTSTRNADDINAVFDAFVFGNMILSPNVQLHCGQEDLK